MPGAVRPARAHRSSAVLRGSVEDRGTAPGGLRGGFVEGLHKSSYGAVYIDRVPLSRWNAQGLI